MGVFIMKKCKICNQEKPTNQFLIDKKMKGKVGSYCKPCANKKNTDFIRTKKGIFTTIYCSQVHSSIHRGHPKPSYDRSYLIDRFLNTEIFNLLYDNWVDSGYDKWLKPSIDRIDAEKPYSESNIQIMTWRQNKDKFTDSIKNGSLTTFCKPVIQYDLNGNEIGRYKSTQEASRKTGCSQDAISRCSNGKKESVKGYTFRFEKSEKQTSNNQV